MLKKYFSLNVVVFTLFIADRFLKNWFLQNPSETIGGGFIFDLINFKMAKNQGIAFGILLNKTVLLVLIGLVILVLVYFLVKSYRQKDFFEVAAFSLVVFGAFSNFIDRLRYGYVIDYIDLRWFSVFNLADVMITAGVIIIGFIVLVGERLDKKKNLV